MADVQLQKKSLHQFPLNFSSAGMNVTIGTVRS